MTRLAPGFQGGKPIAILTKAVIPIPTPVPARPARKPLTIPKENIDFTSVLLVLSSGSLDNKLTCHLRGMDITAEEIGPRF